MLEVSLDFWQKIILSSFFSYLISFIGLKCFIYYVNKKELFQPIRSDGPESHLKFKKKTPSMGGLIIVTSTILTSLIFTGFKNPYILSCLIIFASFAVIGLIDDLMKVIKKNTNGFKGSYKIVIQFAIIGAVYLWLGYVNDIYFQNYITIPFLDNYQINLGSLLYILFISFVVVGSSNAVNLTDGLDGLVSVPAIINLIILSILIYFSSDELIAEVYGLNYIRDSQDLIILLSILIFSILAFLRFNLKPAKIFMGDVGSLAIGAMLGLIAIIIKQELIFFVISLLFVIEALSVIIQVTSYKLFKKKVFLMSPIHHHFEKLGWSEVKVVRFFWFLSLLFSAIGILILLF